MASISDHLREPVTVLTSLPPTEGWVGRWVQLAADDKAADPVDVDAHGTMHWVPRHNDGLLSRACQILEWLQQERPAYVVVDVSIEVATLVRLAGVPVVVVAMPGDRLDPAHQLAYDLADALLAPYPPFLADGWPERWRVKTHHVGAFSRFDGRQRVENVRGNRALCQGVLLWGAGGEDPSGAVRRLVHATPTWTWEVAAPGCLMDETTLWRALCSADVVVTHGGANAVAEVAAACAPAVVVADARPFDEQLHRVRVLGEHHVAVAVDSWPQDDDWPCLLEAARRLGGNGWTRWSFGDGAVRAAALLDRLVGELSEAPLVADTKTGV
jgi:hypothetical protein